MRDIDGARMLLDLARKDRAAMLVLKDADEVGDQAFGFHAQQAVEKALKAWLSVLGVPYPFTHSLDTLLGLLEDEVGEEDVCQFRGLDVLGPFAVQFRYIAYDSEDDLDKDAIVSDVDKLLQYVGVLVGDKR